MRQSSLRTVLISPFRSAAEKLPPMQALQSCQRFLPLLTAAPASNSSADSLHSLAGFYLSLLSRAGVAEPSKLSTLRVLLPSLCWLRAAAAVAPPADPVPPTVLDFIFRLYSLALRALPAMPSTVEYLRYAKRRCVSLLCPCVFDCSETGLALYATEARHSRCGHDALLTRGSWFGHWRRPRCR